MRKTFVKNLILLQALNLIIKPVWLLLIDRKAQNLLGTDYAEYYIAFNLAVVVNIILDIGIQNFSNTGVAADKQFFKVNFKQIVLAKFLLSVLYLFVILGLASASGLVTDLIVIVSVNQILNSFVLYFRTNINGLHHYGLDSILSVSDKFFGIVFCVALYYANRISIYGFAMAQLAATGLSFVITAYLNLSYWFKIENTHQVKPFKLSELFMKSLPFALLFALMGFYTRADVMMMKWLLPDALFHCGIYAQSFRLLDAAAMFAMLFSGLLLPMFTRLIHGREDVKPLTNLAASLLLMVSITASSAAYLFNEPIMARLYDFADIEQLRLSASVFGNILMAFIPMSMTFVFSTLLTAKRDLFYLNLFALSALICNVVLNLILIPKYGSYGASISSLATQSLFAVLSVWRSFRLFGFKIQFNELLKYLGFIVILMGVFVLVKGIRDVWIALSIYALAALMLVFALRLLDIRQILNTFKMPGNKI